MIFNGFGSSIVLNTYITIASTYRLYIYIYIFIHTHSCQQCHKLEDIPIRWCPTCIHRAQPYSNTQRDNTGNIHLNKWINLFSIYFWVATITSKKWRCQLWMGKQVVQIHVGWFRLSGWWFHTSRVGWCETPKHNIIPKQTEDEDIINNWLVVWNIFFIFPYIWNNHPNWSELHDFSEG